MVQLYFVGALICAILLIVLSVFILLKNYTPRTAKFAGLFFAFGTLGVIFIYFGVYENLPQVETKNRIEQGIQKLEILKQEEFNKRKRIKSEISQIYSRNEDLVEEFNTIREKDKALTYTRAILDKEVNSILTFLQHNYANIQDLNNLEKQIDVRVKQIELDIIKAKADLISWETSGGSNGDIDSYMLEEHIYSRISAYKQKISKVEAKETKLRPLNEVWDALLKYQL